MKLRKWLLIAALSVASVVSFTLAACTGGVSLQVIARQI